MNSRVCRILCCVLCGGVVDMDDQSNEDVEARALSAQCPEMTRKALKGVALTLLIAMSWVGTLHLLKLSFEYDHQRTLASHSIVLSESDPIDSSNEDIEDDIFNASESTVQSIPVSCNFTLFLPSMRLFFFIGLVQYEYVLRVRFERL